MGLLRRAEAGLRHRVIGSTFHSRMERETFERASRRMQVMADVRRRTPGLWLALDDDAGDWATAHLDRLVASDESLGLESPRVPSATNSRCYLASPPLRAIQSRLAGVRSILAQRMARRRGTSAQRRRGFAAKGDQMPGTTEPGRQHLS